MYNYVCFDMCKNKMVKYLKGNKIVYLIYFKLYCVILLTYVNISFAISH